MPFVRCAALALAILPFASPASEAADLLAPPAGIAPVNLTLDTVLARNRHAIGKVPFILPDTTLQQWTVAQNGLTGTRSIVRAGDDLRVDQTLGPFHTAYGHLGGKAWEQDANGQVLRLAGIHKMDEISDAALESSQPAAHGVSLLGMVRTPAQAYVVQVAPPGGRREWMFYDAASFQLVREERIVEDRREVETFSDFRSTKGKADAWHVHYSDGDTENDGDYVAVSIQRGVTVDRSSLAVPAERVGMVTLDGPRVTLPVSVLADRVVLHAQIAGKDEAFQLDSGASGVLFDRDEAVALHLTTFGGGTESVAGKFHISRATIPLISIGGVQLHDVTVDVAPFAEYMEQKTHLVGLLGDELLHHAVVHIDYVDGTAEALAPDSFVPPAGAIAVPIVLDDHVPIVDASIDGATGNLFIVDTGADRSTLFSGFARAHPRETTDQGLGDEMLAAYPFFNQTGGVGGSVEVRSLQVKDFHFAGYTFPHWTFDLTQGQRSFEGDDYDGLIGQDLLRNYDLYLDYPHAKLYFVPNERFKNRWGP